MMRSCGEVDRVSRTALSICWIIFYQSRNQPEGFNGKMRAVAMTSMRRIGSSRTGARRTSAFSFRVCEPDHPDLACCRRTLILPGGSDRHRNHPDHRSRQRSTRILAGTRRDASCRTSACDRACQSGRVARRQSQRKFRSMDWSPVMGCCSKPEI